MLASSLMYIIEFYNKQVLGEQIIKVKGGMMILHNGSDVSMVNLRSGAA